MIARILIIDDDEGYQRVFAKLVQVMGHSAMVASTLSEGIEQSESKQFDVVLLDVHLPDGSGLEAIPRFQQGTMPPEIIIVTGLGDADGAELAMQSGVWDYINKGSTLDATKMSLTRALQYRESRRVSHVPVALKTEGMIGSSSRFMASIDFLAQAADSTANVLVMGETGTGKELFARAIHDNSHNATGHFIVVDCAALPETLVESILFGHEKGAFTGADQDQEGLVTQADGGTLFLDEVGELPLSMQKSFLRVLQERRFRPVGSNNELSSNFRLLAATNRNLEKMVSTKKFREDLLYRLRGLTIELPPLRDRTEDIKPLVLHYVTKICELRGREPVGFSPDFFEVLLGHSWPGNVRELINTLEGTVALAGNEPILYSKHLPPTMRAGVARAIFPKKEKMQLETNEDFIMPEDLPPLKEIRDKVEKKYLEKLTADSGNDVKALCSISGLSRARVYALLKKHGLDRQG